jgi:hypothetical protein
VGGTIYAASPPVPSFRLRKFAHVCSWRWLPCSPGRIGRSLGLLRTAEPALDGDGDQAAGGPGVAGIDTATFLADVENEVLTALLPKVLTAPSGACSSPGSRSDIAPCPLRVTESCPPLQVGCPIS